MEPRSDLSKQMRQWRVQESAASWMLKQNKSYQKINKEWSVDHKELNFKKELRRGHQYSIHEGQWHGDVFIYKLNLNKRQLTTSASSKSGSISSSSSSLSISSSLSSTPNSCCTETPDSYLQHSRQCEVFSFQLQQDDSATSDDEDDVFVATTSPTSLKLNQHHHHRHHASENNGVSNKRPALNKMRQLDSAYSSLSSLDQCPSPICCQHQQQQTSNTCKQQQQQTNAMFGQSALDAVTASQRTTTVMATTGVLMLSNGSHPFLVDNTSNSSNTTTTTVTSTGNGEQQQQQEEVKQQKIEDTVRFYEDLVKLCSVAHENFVLFMGASLDIDSLYCSIIMSKCNGPTLYQCLHQPCDTSNSHSDRPFKSRYHSMDANNKRNIAHQIAMGMAYLHGKQMVHGKLSSVNIILDYRVKICLIDHGVTQMTDQREGYGCLNRGQLTYMSPEIIRQLYVEPDSPSLQSRAPTTKESDVYALGTLMYELFCEQFPYKGASSDEIIWRSGSGNQDQLNNDCQQQLDNDDNRHIKELIKQCWSYSPIHRPTFSEIALDILNEVDSSSYNIIDDDNYHDHMTTMSSPSSLASYGQSVSFPSTPTNFKQHQSNALQQFNNIRIMKKQKNFLSKSLFSSKESMF